MGSADETTEKKSGKKNCAKYFATFALLVAVAKIVVLGIRASQI